MFPWQFCRILGHFGKKHSVVKRAKSFVLETCSKALACHPPTHHLTIAVSCCLSASCPHVENGSPFESVPACIAEGLSIRRLGPGVAGGIWMWGARAGFLRPLVCPFLSDKCLLALGSLVDSLAALPLFLLCVGCSGLHLSLLTLRTLPNPWFKIAVLLSSPPGPLQQPTCFVPLNPSRHPEFPCAPFKLLSTFSRWHPAPPRCLPPPPPATASS